MDDVAGCRLIFPDIVHLHEFRKRVHGARFKHKRRNDADKYDYIKSPKATGYRGIHDVYEYNVNSEHGKDYKGLFIELQYRTAIQHAWATAVEIIGFITESQPKFQEGDDRYERIMALASEIIARAHENATSCCKDMTDEELVKQFLKLDAELNLLTLLRNLSAADKEVSAKRNTILIFSGSEQLEVKSFRNATDALRALFELEKSNPGKDVVLVKADTSDDVRIAFRNYFSDAGEFIRIVEDGCQKLAGTKVMHATPVTVNPRSAKR